MATPSFPASLPAPLMSGYGYRDDAGNVSKSPQLFGFQTQKQIGNTPFTDFSVGFVFTQAQMLIFEDFYRDDLINGHKWFIMSLQVGANYLAHHCRMPEKYSANLISNSNWQVGFMIEVDVKKMISQEIYEGTESLWAYANGYPSYYTTYTILTSFAASKWPA